MCTGRNEKPVLVGIEKIVDEAKDCKTFVFRHNLGAKPGQFIMLWIPGESEKPFSISYQDKDKFAVTVFRVGAFTGRLFSLNPGDRVGIRGPYGSCFRIEGKSIVLVGGGCGCAPLSFLADEARKKGVDVHFIMGARSACYALYIDRMRKGRVKTYVSTDDGSLGTKGFATDLLKPFLENKKAGKVFACGPEIMLKRVVEMCRNSGVSVEASLERYMKCGYGVCGQCSVDPLGIRVCVEGPVFSGDTISRISEFSSYKRSASGKKVKF